MTLSVCSQLITISVLSYQKEFVFHKTKKKCFSIPGLSNYIKQSRLLIPTRDALYIVFCKFNTSGQIL